MIDEATFDTVEDRRLAAALNDAAFLKPVPPSLTAKIALAERGLQPRQKSGGNRGIPRWLKVAAAGIALASFISFAAVVVERMSSTAETSSGGDELTSQNGKEATEGTEVTAFTSQEDAVPNSPSNKIEGVVAQQLGSSRQLKSNQGGTEMNIKQKAKAVLASVAVVAGLTPPVSAGVSSASSVTMASFSSFAANRSQTQSALAGGFHSFVSQTIETDTLPKFNSSEPRGMRIIFR